jgi:catalase
MLATEAAAVAWVHDAFAHLKVIGASAGAVVLLDAAGVVPDKGVLIGGETKPFLTAVARGRIWGREPSVRTVF